MAEWEKQEGLDIWLPGGKNDELVGECAGIAEGNYGPQWQIKKEDGSVVRTPSHKVLQNRMAQVKVGSFVKIVYTGEEPPKVRGQNPMKMYDVFIKKAD